MNKIDKNIKIHLWIAFFVISWAFLFLNSYHTKKFERLCNSSYTLLYSPMSMEYLENLSDLDGYSLFEPPDYTSPYWKEIQKRAEIYEAVTNMVGGKP